MDTKIRELESFCQSFLTSNKTDEIKMGEEWLVEFREKASIDDYCIVLSHTTNEFLIFESLKAFTKLMILKWNVYNCDERDMLKDKLLFLFNWSIDNHNRLPHYIWMAAINSVVKMIKKAYSEDFTDIYQLYMEKLDLFLNENSFNSKKVGLEMINNLLDVFSGNGSVMQQVRINKDAEMKIRQEFEKKQLIEIFTNLLNLMVSIEQNSNQSYDQQTFEIVKLIVTNLELIFSWNFLNRASIKWVMTPKNEAAKRFSPPPKWNCVIQDFSIIELLFKIHNKMRFKDGTTTLTCLLLLAGLRVKFRHNSCERNSIESIIQSNNSNNFSNVDKNYYSFSRCQYSFAFIDYLCDFYSCRISSSHNSSGNENGSSSNDAKDGSIYLYDYEVPLLGELLYQLQEHLTSSVWLDGLMIHCIDNGIELDEGKNFPKNVAQEFAHHVVDKLSKFTELYTIFLIKCIEGAAMENLSPSDTIYTEASDRILTRFVGFTNFQEYLQYTSIEKPSPFSLFPSFSTRTLSPPTSPDFVSSCAWEKLVFEELVRRSYSCHKRLFQCFLKAHLAAPDGFRNVSVDCDVIIIESDDDGEEFDLEIQEDDKKTYEGSLYASGFSALECISDSVCHITGLLHQRLHQLDSILSSDNIGSTSGIAPFSLLEDMHWLISIAGFTILNVVDDVLTSNNFVFHHMDTSDQKTIYEHSKEQLSLMVQSVNCNDGSRPPETVIQQIVDEYRTLLNDCTRDICGRSNLQGFQYQFGANLTQCDDIIRLFYVCLRGFAVALRGCTSGQIISDFVWLFNRWVIGYLQINENNDLENQQITVLAVFQDTKPDNSSLDGSSQKTDPSNNSGLLCRSNIINTLLHLINICVEKWNHDQSVMECVVILLQNITYSLSISKLLLKSPLWMQKMTQMIVRIDPPYSLVRNDFLSKFVTTVMNVAISCESEQQLNDYLQLMDPIAHRFTSLLSSDSTNVASSKDFETEFVRCLSLLHGLVTTRWPSRLSRIQQQKQWAMGYTRLFQTLYPWLEQCVVIVCNPDINRSSGGGTPALPLSKLPGILLFKPAIVQALLDCMLEIAKTVLLELDHEQTIKFYSLNLHMFRLYANKFKHQQGSVGFDLASNEVSGHSTEDETINEIRLIFSIASELLSRTVFDEFDYDCAIDYNVAANTSITTSSFNRDLESLMGYDVIAQLILYLAPYISMGILEIPDVGTVFFQCATLVAEFRPASFLVNMSQEFNVSLIQLYLKNLKNSNNVIVTYSLRGITSLAEFYYKKTSMPGDADHPASQSGTATLTTSSSQHTESCSFSMNADFQQALTILILWIRKTYITSDLMDYVSGVLIILAKHNEDAFYEQINHWLCNVNTEYVTRKTDELLHSIDPDGVYKRLRNIENLESLSKQPQGHWTTTTWTPKPSVAMTKEEEFLQSSLSSISYRSSITKWNDLVTHINDFMDVPNTD